MAVFLGVNKAYDSVWHPGLLFKLAGIGVSCQMLGWLREFLLNRAVCVRVGGFVSDHRPVKTGFPHGAVISPHLFNLMLIDFPVPPPGISRMLYAEEVTFYTHANPPQAAGRSCSRTSTKSVVGAVNGDLVFPQRNPVLWFSRNPTTRALIRCYSLTVTELRKLSLSVNPSIFLRLSLVAHKYPGIVSSSSESSSVGSPHFSFRKRQFSPCVPFHPTVGGSSISYHVISGQQTTSPR